MTTTDPTPDVDGQLAQAECPLADLSLDAVRALLDCEDEVEDHLPTDQPVTLGALLQAVQRRSLDTYPDGHHPFSFGALARLRAHMNEVWPCYAELVAGRTRARVGARGAQ